MKYPLIFLGWLLAGSALAQTAPVPAGVPQSTTAPTNAQTAPADDLNFEEFGDADDRKIKTYCTQKVLYLSPTKLISVGYEQQGRLPLTSAFVYPVVGSAPDNIPRQTNRTFNSYGGIRLALNTPVISRSNFILNLGLTYWNTRSVVAASKQTALWEGLQPGIRSTGLSLTAYKPLDNRHFLLLQANADANGTYRTFNDFDTKALTLSGTAVYGWKRDDNFMWGLGITRTYRGGNLLHIPVLLYNRTFSPKWGVEAIFPARANLRRSFGTNSLLLLGYELEGNVYYLGRANTATHQSDLFLRRSEIKPRITYERKLAGFVWLSVQAGMAVNWRFNVFSTQNPARSETPVFTNTLANAPYCNVSINLVSP